MEEKSAATVPSSVDDESAPTNVRRSLVGSRRMLFEQQIVSTAAKDIAPPPSSSRVSRVSIRTLPLNDRAAYSSSSSSSSERDSKTPSPQPLPPQPLPSALLDDSTFAKRTSYHHAVFKNPELILPSSSSSRSKTKDEQIAKVEENEVEGRFPSSATKPKDEIEERLPSSASELRNEIEERLPSVGCELKQEEVSVAQPADEKEECVSVPLSLECQPEDEQEVANVSQTEDEAEQRVVSPSMSCPDSVVIISQDLSSARDNDRISSLSSSRNNRESVTAIGTATTTTTTTTTIANEDDCNNDRDEDGDSAKEEPTPTPTTPDPVDYPEELNPFADEEEATVQTKSDRKSLNPFGSDSEDEDESTAETSVTSKHEKHESTNPFGSGSEDEEDQPRAPQPNKPKPNARKMENGSRAKTPVPLPRSTLRTSVVNLSPQPSPRRSVDSSPASSRKLSADSLSSRSGSSSAQSTIRKKKPAPPPPPLAAAIARNSNQQPIFASIEQRSPSSNDKQDADANKNVPKRVTAIAGGGSPWKHKKGPAPARPTPQRRPVKEMPIGDIQTEIGDIEVREQELERQGVQLEQMIRERTQTESPESPGVEEMVLQLFELVNEKNELFRRRSELINMRKMHHLEQEHAELEYQIRCLMLKPASNKTDSDKEKEEELIKKLLDVVERRNEIIEKMEKDRQRETVEDQSVITQLGQDDQKLAKSPPDKKKKDEKKSKKHKKDKTRKDDALLNGDEKEKHHSPSQLIKQKFMTMTLRHSTKKLPPPRLSN